MASFYVLFIADKERLVSTRSTKNPLEVWGDLRVRHVKAGLTVVFVEKHPSAEAAGAREKAFARMSQARRRGFIARRNPKWVDVFTTGVPGLGGTPLLLALFPVAATSTARPFDVETPDDPMPWDDADFWNEGLGGVVAKRTPVTPVRPRGAAKPLPKPDPEEDNEA